MPGYANWATLYSEEFKALTYEGYDTAAAVKPQDKDAPLPLPGQEIDNGEKSAEEFWHEAYEKLWNVRECGLREDYPYVEPISFDDIISSASSAVTLSSLSEGEYEKRVRGAIYGRIAGVILGKPLEIGINRERIKEYLESVGEYPLCDYVSEYSEKLDFHLRGDCVPSTKGNIKFAQPDDDIHYTLLALRLAEKRGFHFNAGDVGYNWLDNVPYHWFWCASRQAYYGMVSLNDNSPRDEQIARIPYKMNPWRECIDGQIRCDMWGYISPADPVEAARMAYTDCSLSLIKNGTYGGMYVAACIAAALSENPTVENIIGAGLSVIPEKSRLAEMIRFVCEKYRGCGDWELTCAAIEEKCDGMAFADTVNNIAMVTLALIHGNLDYTKTISTAVMCGIDTDCNGGTAGSICGAAVGIDGIDRHWTEPLCDCIHSAVADFGQGTITDVVNRTIALRARKRAEDLQKTL